MKKILFCAALLMAIVPVFARTLSPAEALERVNNSGDNRFYKKSLPDMRLVESGEYDGLPSYYIFSDDKNAMILSASDFAVPVIGYIDAPVSKNTPMPPQLKWWLDELGRAIKVAEQPEPQRLSFYDPTLIYGNSGDTETKAGAEGNIRTSQRTDIGPLLKTKWGQWTPFNDLCPPGTPSGCVATAMAQVMKYYNYPERGTGIVSVEYKSDSLYVDLDTLTLDWDNMLDVYNNPTPEQSMAVAKLMKGCGYSVDMLYGSNGSGAICYYLVKALVDNFKYDVAIDYLPRTLYTDDQWEEIVYNELAAGRPVLYDGFGSGGGHQFVCDGYNASIELYHFNWGWDGSYDGLFALDALAPISAEKDFNSRQDIIIGVQKPIPGSKRAEPKLFFSGKTLNASAKGREIIIPSGDYFNSSLIDGIFNIGYSLTNADGKTEYYHTHTNMAIPVSVRVVFYIPKSVPNGTYKLAPLYQVTGTSEWKNIGTSPGVADYVTIHIDGDVITDPVTLTDFTIPSNQIKAGETFNVSVKARNTNEVVETMDVSVRFCTDDPEKEGSVLVAAEAGSKTISIPPTGKERTYAISCTAPANLAPGKYKLCACKGKFIFKSLDISVVNDSEGVSVIIADEDDTVSYFDLQGRPVSEKNLAPGIYIRKKGQTTDKVIVH